MANVVIAGGSEESRLLLRGLVRLHHHRVIAEGHGPEVLAGLSAGLERPVLLLDCDLEDGTWSRQLPLTLRDHPDCRAVLLTSNRSLLVEERAKQAGFHALLRRPFAVHDLVNAIDPPTGPTGGPAAPTPGAPP